MQTADAAIRIQTVGVIETPFTEPSGTPIQSAYSQGAEGRVLVRDPFVAALDDIEGFDRIWLIYWMDRVGPFKPKVIPYRDTREHGLFATRSPTRPNPIGLSIVRLMVGPMSVPMRRALRCNSSRPRISTSTRALRMGLPRG